jgi:hypothetical protein
VTPMARTEAAIAKADEKCILMKMWRDERWLMERLCRECLYDSRKYKGNVIEVGKEMWKCCFDAGMKSSSCRDSRRVIYLSRAPSRPASLTYVVTYATNLAANLFDRQNGMAG